MKETLKLALEALEYTTDHDHPHYEDQLTAITAITEALAQPEQKPWMYRIWNDKDAQWRLTDDCSWPAEPVYTTPPKRPWVGLTDEEISEIEDEYIVDYRIPAGSAWNFAKAIEAKLKEKNNGN